jgi:hypothetical protein
MSHATKMAVLYILLSALALAANLFFKLDVDMGGYPDKWYPEKQLKHFVAALAITSAACLIGVTPWVAFLITGVNGILFELTQGYVNEHDIIADVLGAFVAVGAFILIRN